MNERLLSPDAAALFEKEMGYLTHALTGVTNLLGIDTVLLAGDLRYEGEITAKALTERVSARLLRRGERPFRVACAHADENTKPRAAAESVFSKFLQA